MAPIPADLEDSLPDEVRAADVAASARVARSFDRAQGEALLLRMRSGEALLLTRPDRAERFRALPLADREPLAIVQGRDVRLHARMSDGRLLTMPLTMLETDAVRAALGLGITRSPSAPPTRAPTDRPLRPASLRPPERAESEIVRVPRSVRAPSEVPSARATRPPQSRPLTSPPRAASVRPPAFAADPAPIVRSARDVPALRARFRHLWDQGQLDEAIEVARVLVHLGVSDPVERRLASQHPEAPPSLAKPLGPFLFRAYLAHDDENEELARLLTAIAPAYLALRARPEHELGLRPGDEVDLARPTHPFAQLFARAARDLALSSSPRLFLRDDVPGGLALLPTAPIGSVCGGTLASGFDAASTLHVIGHHLALTRPEAQLFVLASTGADVASLVLAVLWLEGKLAPEQAKHVDARIGALAESLARAATPPMRESIRAACAGLVIRGDARGALAKPIEAQRRAIHLAAARTGFLLSGSLAVSERMQRVMPAVPGVPLDDVLDDLVTYAVSPGWAALRKELGIAIEVSEPGEP